MNYKVIVKNIQENLARYIKANGIEALILGVSGGIDSAVCAALAKPVCDKFRIPLIGRSLPSLTNKLDEKVRASSIGNAFCNDFEIMPIDDIAKDITNNLFTEDKIKVKFYRDCMRQGNIKARVRMIILYDLAQSYNGMVLSTDNYTEYLLGFWTLHGDVGDYGMIQSLWKTEVYELAKFMSSYLYRTCKDKAGRSIMDCIVAVPTDGLGITESDFEQLGANSYKEIDTILQKWLSLESHKTIQELEEHPVIQRHLKTMFKRNNPCNISREDIIGEKNYG